MIKSKNWLVILFIICFITQTYAQINTPSTATVPFGSKIAASANPYGYGIIPATLPTGAYTPASNLYGKSQDAYTAYNTWKTNYVRACGTQYRVLFDDNSSTVSEGIGYGMLLAAYAADKALFDGLWAYYKTNSNNNKLMNWKISGCTGASGTNGATDADLDAAMALIIASKQWPSATSPYTYSTEANTLITAIKTYEIHNTSFQAINGDGWGMGATCRNPSYQSPAYYRQFATQVSSQASTWNSAVTAAYTLLNANRNTTTGLVSNWSEPNGTPNGCNGANEYGYDACRNPWRMATEVLWTGNTTAQTNFCIPIAAYINGRGANNASGPVPQSGGSGGYVNATFVSTYAAGICGATTTYQSIMNSMYTKTVNTVDGSGYFGNTLRVLSLFMQTGNFWNPSTISSCTLPSAAGTITGSSPVCANATGITYSIATVSNATGYTWTVPSGATITGGAGTNSITVKMGTANGNVTVIPTNTCGNGTVSSKSITVNAVVTPTVSIAVTPSNNIYAGQSVTFTATYSNGGSPTFQWKKGGTTISGATSSTYTTTALTNGNVITVTMTSNAVCATTAQANSNSITMTVKTNPPFSTTISGPTSVTANQTSVTYSVTNQTGMTYNWSVPAGATIVSGQGTNSIVVNFGTSSGNVKLIQTNPIGQTSTTTVPVNVATTTPILISSGETLINIYPIPCAETITIELSESTSTNVSYILIDALGNNVLTETQSYSGTPIDIDMPVAPGMYQLIVTWDDYKIIKKIIKK